MLDGLCSGFMFMLAPVGRRGFDLNHQVEV